MAEAPDPDDNPFFNGNTDDLKHPLSRDMSFDENDLKSEEKQVVDETEKIFKTFLFTRLISDIEQDAEDAQMNVTEISPTVLSNLRAEKIDIDKMQEDPSEAKMVELGKILATLGDEVNHKYKHEFNTMVCQLDLQEEFAFDSFQKIARRLFSGGINWGRIVALFLFGYRIAVTFIRGGVTGARSFVRKILKYMVGFLFKEHIVKWIIEQGGWIKFELEKKMDNNWALGVVGVLAALFASYGIYKISTGDSS